MLHFTTFLPLYSFEKVKLMINTHDSYDKWNQVLNFLLLFFCLGLCEVSPFPISERQLLIFPGHYCGTIQIVVSLYFNFYTIVTCQE